MHRNTLTIATQVSIYTHTHIHADSHTETVTDTKLNTTTNNRFHYLPTRDRTSAEISHSLELTHPHTFAFFLLTGPFSEPLKIRLLPKSNL